MRIFVTINALIGDRFKANHRALDPFVEDGLIGVFMAFRTFSFSMFKLKGETTLGIMIEGYRFPLGFGVALSAAGVQLPLMVILMAGQTLFFAGLRE